MGECSSQPAAKAPRPPPSATEDEALTSPSLLRSASETAEAVGRCFHECHPLYGLVAEAVVGRHAHHDTAMALSTVSTAFHGAVRTAIEAWCKSYRALQAAYAERARRAPLSDHSRVFIKLREHVAEAFGDNYVSALDDVLMLSSLMDHRTYMHVQARRCVLCGSRMPRNSQRWRSNFGWHIHAHTECVARHCVPQSYLNCFFSFSKAYTSVDHDNKPRILDDAIAAAKHFCKDSMVDDPKEQAVAMVEKMTACGVLSTKKSGLVWVHPHRAVTRTDTLLGALGITPSKLEELHRAAHKIRMVNVEEIRKRQDARKQKLIVMAEERMNEFASELLRQGRRMRTISDVEGLHPTAAELFGLRRLASTHNYLRVKTVLRRIDLFEAFTAGPSPGDITYKALQIWLLSGTANFSKLLTIFNTAAGSASKMSPALRSVATRMANMLVTCKPDVDHPNFVRQTVVDGDQLISVRVRMRWPGIAAEDVKFCQEFTVLELRIMRTQICDRLGISLPPIPHPRSEFYQESSMTDALQQLVAACFDRRTLQPETHAQGLSLVGALSWLWRLYIRCENATQLAQQQQAPPDVPAADAEDEGDDSDTSGEW